MFKTVIRYCTYILCVLVFSSCYADIDTSQLMREIQINSSSHTTDNVKNKSVSITYSKYGDSYNQKEKKKPTPKKNDNFYSKANTNTLIGKLAKKGYSLVFFFDSKCPHCQKFAPIVKDVSTKYGISVYPFTFGGTLPSFTQPIPVNRSIYQTYYGSTKPFFPVMFLQNTNTMQFYLVAKGETSQAQVVTILNHYARGLLHV